MNAGTILVGIDHSPGSVLALQRARSLAETTGRALVVCAVLEHGVEEAGVTEAESRLTELAPRARVIVRAGTPFVELIRAARQIDADLIVVGATGQHTRGHLALGVTVDRLARKADRPVLVVRRPDEGPYSSILVGIDGSSDSKSVTHLAREMAPKATITGIMAVPLIGESHLLLTGVNEDALNAYRQRVLEDGRGLITELANELPIDDHLAVLGRPEAVLIERAASSEADLVAVGRRGVNPLASVLLGSVAHHVVHEASCDVLVYRPREIDFELP